MKHSDQGLDLSAKRTRKREFLDEMERVVPSDMLVALLEPRCGAKGKASGVGRPPFELQTMLRIHFLQQWFALSDPAMEEALFDVPLFGEFAELPTGVTRLPDESTILRFRHLLEKHGLQLAHDCLVSLQLNVAPLASPDVSPGRPRAPTISLWKLQRQPAIGQSHCGPSGLRGFARRLRGPLALKCSPMPAGIGCAPLAQPGSRMHPRKSRVPDETSGLAPAAP
jgi:hypothetical protein